MRKSWSMIAAMLTAVAMFTLMACGGGTPPTVEECEKEMDKAEKFFEENEDKEEELAKKHTGMDELFDKAFEGEDVNWDDVEKQMTAMVADGLKMAGANVKCASVLAKAQVQEFKDMAEMFGDLDIDFDDEDWDEDEE